MRVVGIDPGTRKVGYAIIEKNGNRLSYIMSGAVNTKATMPLPQRLRNIYAEVSEVIQKYAPTQFAIEKVFYGKNFSSAIKMGEGRGVLLLIAAQNDLDIHEYDATKIKKSVVGAGKAHKSQVSFMVKRILAIDKEVTEDEGDALAIAICHCQNHNSPLKML